MMQDHTRCNYQFCRKSLFVKMELHLSPLTQDFQRFLCAKIAVDLMFRGKVTRYYGKLLLSIPQSRQ